MVVENTVHHPSMVEAAEARAIAPDAKPHDHDHEHHDQEHDHDHSLQWPEALRIGLVAIAAAGVWFRVWEPFPAISIIGVVGLLIGGWPILKEAFENILERRMTMELSMTIAIVAAAGIGQFFTALVITLFVLVAEVLEGLTVGRGRRAIRDLLEFLPREVSVRHAGSIRSVSAERTIGGRCHPGRARRADSCRRGCALGRFLRRRIPHYRRIHAGREAGWRASLRRVHQPIRGARGARRTNWTRHELRQDHGSGRAGGTVSRTSATSRRSPRRLSRLFRDLAPPS